MRWKRSWKKKIWSQWCVEDSNTGNKAKQDDQWVGWMLKCWCENQPNAPLPWLRGWKELSLGWEFLLPEGRLLSAAYHNAVDGFLRNYSCQEKGRRKKHLCLPLQESNQKVVVRIMINNLLNINDWPMICFGESHHMSSLLLFLCLSDLFFWTLRTQVGLLELAGRKMFIFYPAQNWLLYKVHCALSSFDVA